LDEERQSKDLDNIQSGSPAFLHLVIPFSRDVALTGPNSFENYKLGVGLNAKFFSDQEITALLFWHQDDTTTRVFIN
jgi:hypothetical protein